MIDLVKAARELMLAQAGIVAQVGALVYAHDLPKDFPKGPDAPKALLIKDTKESEVGVQNPIHYPFLLVEAYGPNNTAANDVWLAVIDALNNKQGLSAGGVTWKGCWIERDGETMKVEPQNWCVKVFRLRGVVI